MPRGLLLLLWLLAGVGCASGSQPKAGAAPITPGWQSTLDRDHPLAGRIWHVASRRFIDEATLIAATRTARVVLIGEQHDNADHHRLQARVLGALIAARREPAIVFEMIEVAQQPNVDRVRAAGGDAASLAQAVSWESSGWPAFALYRPLFEDVLAAKLPIVAAGIDRPLAMRVAREGVTVLGPELVQRFALDTPLPPDQQGAIREEMAEAHCGLMPEAMLDAMVQVQRARDAQLADAAGAALQMAAAVVVIAGNGHARSDRGVPAALQRGHGVASLAIGLFEVERALTEPQQYAASYGGTLPFEYIWFTPRASDTDHCAELRATMQKSGHGHGE